MAASRPSPGWANFGPAAAEVRLKLFTNDRIRPSNADHLTIPAGETRGLAFPLDDFDSGVLHVKAETATNWPWTTRPGPSSTRPAGPASC